MTQAANSSVPGNQPATGLDDPSALGCAAIIVEYRSGPHLERAVRSLVAQDVPIERICVVANSPVNGSGLCALHPNLVVIPSSNVGFGAAVNLGMSEVGDIPFILVMNPDVVLLGSDCLRSMRDAMHQRPDVGLVGPRLLWSPHGPLQRSGSQFPTPLDEITQQTRLRTTTWGRQRLGRLWLSGWDRQTSRPVDVISGACFLVRRSAFRDIGGFDPGYFLYFEEVDLCKRLDDAKWTRYFCARAEAAHISGGSTDSTAVSRMYRRSRRRYMGTYHSTALAVAAEGVLAIYDVLRRPLRRNARRITDPETRRRAATEATSPHR